MEHKPIVESFFRLHIPEKLRVKWKKAMKISDLSILQLYSPNNGLSKIQTIQKKILKKAKHFTFGAYKKTYSKANWLQNVRFWERSSDQQKKLDD